MAKPVRVTITGTADTVSDAPTVNDLIGQLRDLAEVFRGVEKALLPDRGSELVWRITDASKNSPLSLELTPYSPTDAAANVAERATKVERATAEGLIALRRGEARPAYFTDDILPRAKRLYQRVQNGLADTTISFDADVAEAIVIDRPAAEQVERKAEAAKGQASIPYREIGSVEGYITKPELDGYGRAVLRFKARLTGAEVKAYARGEAFHQVEQLRLSDVWNGARVRVYGLINYKGLGQIDVINASGIELLDVEPLPGIDDIVDPTFTGGLSTEEFLRRQRGLDA
jgi:hypothetical protein